MRIGIIRYASSSSSRAAFLFVIFSQGVEEEKEREEAEYTHSHTAAEGKKRVFSKSCHVFAVIGRRRTKLEREEGKKERKLQQKCVG